MPTSLDLRRRIIATKPKTQPIPELYFEVARALSSRGLDVRGRPRRKGLPHKNERVRVTGDRILGPITQADRDAYPLRVSVWCPSCGRELLVRRPHARKRPVNFCSSNCKVAMGLYCAAAGGSRGVRTGLHLGTKLVVQDHYRARHRIYRDKIADSVFRFMTRAVTATTSGPVVPASKARLVSGVEDLVAGALEDAKQALAGTKKWDKDQVRLFLGLLDKAVPTSVMSGNIHIHKRADPNSPLSREELERIASGEIVGSVDQDRPGLEAVLDLTASPSDDPQSGT